MTRKRYCKLLRALCTKFYLEYEKQYGYNSTYIRMAYLTIRNDCRTHFNSYQEAYNHAAKFFKEEYGISLDKSREV